MRAIQPEPDSVPLDPDAILAVVHDTDGGENVRPATRPLHGFTQLMIRPAALSSEV
jgi:hypothetical protein